MGKYNDAYKSYYNEIISKEGRGSVKYNNSRSAGSFNYNASTRGIKGRKITLQRIVNIIIFQLAGTAALFVIILFCKTVTNSKTDKIYSYAKDTVNTSFDYNGAIAQIKTFDYKKIYDSVETYIENIKVKYLGGSNVIETTSENFRPPIKGDVIGKYGNAEDLGWVGYKDGIVIKAAEGSKVTIASKGKVREVGNSEALGNYIIVDHGDGLETEYGNLKDVNVERGDDLEENAEIGTSGGKGNLSSEHLYFSLLYMGAPKDPEKYIKFYNQSI